MSVYESVEYVPFRPRVEKLKGTKLITRTGIVLLDKAWTRASTYRNPVVFARVLGISMLSALKRKAVRVPDEPQLGIIHSIWTAGYYHWITECLPRALVMREQFPDAVPVLPSARYKGYVASLNALGFSEVSFFPEGTNILVKDPVLTECPRRFATTSPELLEKVRDLIWSNLGIVPDAEPSRIVYVSRRKARGRFVLNEQAVIELLQSYGAEIVCFEDLNFAQQVKLMAGSRMLISIHGAGLVNALFMPRGAAVVELTLRNNGIIDYTAVRNSIRHDSSYVRLATALRHRHYGINCATDSNWYSRSYLANITVDLQVLKQTVEKAISEGRGKRA